MSDPDQMSPDRKSPDKLDSKAEWWVWLMLLLFAAVIAGHLWVFHGPDRELALWLYKKGRFLAVLTAFGLGAGGLLTALLRPPLVQKWRLAGLLMALIVMFSAPVPYAFPSSHRGKPIDTVLQMPLKGSWRVLAGGRGAQNPLSLEPDRSQGLLLAREVDGKLWKDRADGVDFSGSNSYDQPVYAPARGEVVAAVGDQADRSFQHKVELATGRGNHLVIRLGEGQYLILAHLLKGSLQVGVGDLVELGQSLARVGSSGRGVPLTEPHLDIHISSQPGESEGEGIPFLMGGYALDGVPIEAGSPLGGLGRGDYVEGELLIRTL